MEVSIIIVSYNSKDLLCSCIRSVIDHTKDITYEIIVVDNNSLDGSVEVVSQLFPSVTLIRSHTNLGFAKANNVGINSASGEFLLLLNPDTLLLDNAIAKFLAFMRRPSSAKIAVCGGRLFGPRGEPGISYGNFPSVKEVFWSLGLCFVFKAYYYKNVASAVVGSEAELREVDFISGADMFIRKSALEEAGLFDEDFFLYCEEAELSFRIRSKGYVSVLLPHVKILHIEGGSQSATPRITTQKLKIVMRSRMLFFRKCYGDWTALVVKLLYVLRAILEGFVRLNLSLGLRKAYVVWKS